MKILKILLHALQIFTLLEAKRDFRILGKRLECGHTEPELIIGFTCQLAQRNNRFYGSGSLYLNQSLASFNLRGMLMGMRKGVARKTVDLCLDVCQLLENSHKVKIVRVLLENFRRSVNEMPKCPLKSHFNYTLTDFYLDENDLPSYVPEVEFRVSLWFYRAEKRIFFLNIYAQIIYEKKIKSG